MSKKKPAVEKPAKKSKATPVVDAVASTPVVDARSDEMKAADPTNKHNTDKPVPTPTQAPKKAAPETAHEMATARLNKARGL